MSLSRYGGTFTFAITLANATRFYSVLSFYCWTQTWTAAVARIKSSARPHQVHWMWNQAIYNCTANLFNYQPRKISSFIYSTVLTYMSWTLSCTFPSCTRILIYIFQHAFKLSAISTDSLHALSPVRKYMKCTTSVKYCLSAKYRNVDGSNEWMSLFRTLAAMKIAE